MKHTVSITRIPAKAVVENHPSLKDSFAAFLEDPLGVIRLHLSKDGDA